MRAGWMRPSWSSFSSVMRAISRRTPSKPREHDRARRVVDDEVDAGEVLQRADVAALAADDAALHVVGRQLDDGHRRLRRVAGGEALHRDGEDRAHAPLGVALGLLLDLAQDFAASWRAWSSTSLTSCVLGLRGAQAGDALERALVLLAASSSARRSASSACASARRARPRAARAPPRAARARRRACAARWRAPRARARGRRAGCAPPPARCRCRRRVPAPGCRRRERRKTTAAAINPTATNAAAITISMVCPLPSGAGRGRPGPLSSSWSDGPGRAGHAGSRSIRAANGRGFRLRRVRACSGTRFAVARSIGVKTARLLPFHALRRDQSLRCAGS